MALSENFHHLVHTVDNDLTSIGALNTGDNEAIEFMPLRLWCFYLLSCSTKAILLEPLWLEISGQCFIPEVLWVVFTKNQLLRSITCGWR